MGNETAMRKALVGGLNFDGVLGEDYLFEGNMVRLGYREIDITDALISEGMRYLVEQLRATVEIESAQLGLNIGKCEAAKALFTENLAKALCALYSMGEQNKVATDREMAAQRARSWSKAETREVEDAE